MQQAIADVWGLLTTLGQQPKFDRLIAACITVLIQVSKGVYAKGLFSDPKALQNICENVVIPNVQFRPSDEEAFKFNPQEYIRADYEGSDTDTRRRAACELITALRKVRACVHAHNSTCTRTTCGTHAVPLLYSLTTT